MIKHWWQLWLDANVALATGTASGVVALDVDPRHGGEASLANLEASYQSLPDTAEVLTGGGGRHLLFKHPGGRVPNRPAIAPGLDIRGDGGYIIGPPSLHMSGRRYEWEVLHHPDDVELAPMPAWLLAVVRDAESSKSKTALPEGVVAEGARNDTLFRMGCKMRRDGFSEAAIREALEITNQERCAPPLHETEVANIAASAARYEPSQSSPSRVPLMRGPLRVYQAGAVRLKTTLTMERRLDGRP